MIGQYHSGWYFQTQIAGKMFDQKVEAMKVLTWLSELFFSWRVNVWHSCQRLFPSFCTQPYEVALVFHWIVNGSPVPRQFDDSGLLRLCCSAHYAQDKIWHRWLCSYDLFIQRRTNDWTIERSHLCCFFCDKFSLTMTCSCKINWNFKS